MSYFVWERCTGGWRFVASHRTLGSAQRQVEAIKADGGHAIIASKPPVE